MCPQPKRLDQVYRNNKTTPLRDNFLSLIKEHSQKLNHFFLISEKANITVRFTCRHHNNNVDDSKIKEIKSLCKRRCKYSSKHSFLVHDFNIELLKLRALYNLENINWNFVTILFHKSHNNEWKWSIFQKVVITILYLLFQAVKCICITCHHQKREKVCNILEASCFYR